MEDLSSSKDLSKALSPVSLWFATYYRQSTHNGTKTIEHKFSALRASPAYTATCEHCDRLALQPSQTLRFKAAHKRRQRNRPYLQMVVLKCCGNELTKRVLSTLSPVLAQCGLNLPKVSKSKIKAKQLVLSNATERSDLSITTARATQFALINPLTLTHEHKAMLSHDHTLVKWGVKANHQVMRFQRHAKNSSTFFPVAAT